MGNIIEMNNVNILESALPHINTNSVLYFYYKDARVDCK